MAHFICASATAVFHFNVSRLLQPPTRSIKIKTCHSQKVQNSDSLGARSASSKHDPRKTPFRKSIFQSPAPPKFSTIPSVFAPQTILVCPVNGLVSFGAGLCTDFRIKGAIFLPLYTGLYTFFVIKSDSSLLGGKLSQTVLYPDST